MAGLSRFYDDFAGAYHLLFEDWEASMSWQAGVIASILDRECPLARGAVLDCACGIGTQALGLANLGFCVTGSDVSEGAVERARSEAAMRGLHIPFYVADMRNLDEVPATGFHAVICMDNALPRLLSEADLAQAAGQIRGNCASKERSSRASEIMTRSSRGAPLCMVRLSIQTEESDASCFNFGTGRTTADTRFTSTLHGKPPLDGRTFTGRRSIVRSFATKSPPF
jgi:Methyltransferase domain